MSASGPTFKQTQKLKTVNPVVIQMPDHKSQLSLYHSPRSQSFQTQNYRSIYRPVYSYPLPYYQQPVYSYPPTCYQQPVYYYPAVRYDYTAVPLMPVQNVTLVQQPICLNTLNLNIMHRPTTDIVPMATAPAIPTKQPSSLFKNSNQTDNKLDNKTNAEVEPYFLPSSLVKALNSKEDNLSVGDCKIAPKTFSLYQGTFFMKKYYALYSGADNSSYKKTIINDVNISSTSKRISL